MKSGAIWLILIVVFVASGLLFLYAHSSADDAIERDTAELKSATIPSNARLVESPPSTRDNHSFQASWTFEVRETWGEYQEWLADHPFLNFRPMPATQPTFGRTLPGDFQSLVVEKVLDGPPLRVQVRFRSIPD